MSEATRAKGLEGIEGYRPVEWDRIPDLGLYMDQVVTYLERQLKGLYGEGERIFTPAMVNNYVKLGLVNRPISKKYGREQLAQLLMICVLKQAASAESMKKLLKPAPGQELQALYQQFCGMEGQVFRELAGESEAFPSPMTAAVRCAAYRFLCNAILTREAKVARTDGEEDVK